MSKLSLDVLFQGNDKLSATLEKMSGNARKLESNLGDLKGKITQLSGLKVRLEGLGKTKKETAEAATKLAAYKKIIKDLQAQMDAGNADKGIVKRLRDAEKEAAKLQNTVNKGRAKISGLASSLESAGYKGQSFAKAQDQIEKELNQATAAMEKQQKRLKSLSDTQESMDKMSAARDKAAGVAVGAGAVVAGLGTAVKTYADSENAEMELKVSMMTNKGEVAKEYNDLIALATKLGTKLPGTTADFHNMMATLVQQGINAKAILGGVGEATGYLAVQMKLPFAEAAEFAAKLQDATKTTEKDMLSLMDVIQRSYYLGVDKTNMLSGFSKMAAGMKTVRMEGLEGAKALAPLLIMADQASMSGEAAGNAYSKIFKAMMDTGAINKALKDSGTGIQMDFTDGKGEFGGLDKMFAQLEKLKGLSTEERLPILSDMFGNDSETIQALNLLIDKGKAGYAETIAKMESQADLQTRVNAQLGTLTNVWDTAKAGAESIWGKVGEALAPTLKDLSLWISSVTEKISTWISQNPTLFATIIKIVAGISAVVAIAAMAVVALTSVLLPMAALKMSILSLSGSFGFIGKGLGVFGKFKTVLGFAKTAIFGVGKAFVTLGKFMLANPIIAIITAIAVAAYLIYANWDKIKPYLMAFWDGIKAKWTQFTTWVGGIWDGIKQKASSAWDGVKNIISGAIDGVVGTFKNIISTIDGIFANNPILNFIFPIIGIPRMIIANWGGISAFFGTLWGNISTAISGAWQSITSTISVYWSAIKMLIGAYATGIWADIVVRFNAVLAFFTGLWANISAMVGGAWMMIKSYVVMEVSAIWSTIVARFNAVAAFISGIWARIKSIISNAWNSLVAIFRGSAILNAIQSAFNAVIGYLSGLGAKMRGIGTNIIDGLIGGIKAGFERLKGVWQTVNSYMPSFSRKSMDIHSPSRVMRRIGGHIIDGMTVGISRRFEPLKKTYGGVMDYLSRPNITTPVTKMAQTVGKSLGSDNVTGDLVRMVAPKLSANPLVGMLLDHLPKLMSRNTAQMPKPAHVTPIKSANAVTTGSGTSAVGASHTSTSNITINIHATPGMDTHALARQVRAELERYEQAKAAKHRARLTD